MKIKSKRFSDLSTKLLIGTSSHISAFLRKILFFKKDVTHGMVFEPLKFLIIRQAGNFPSF